MASHRPTFLGLKGQSLVYAVTITSGLGFLLFGYDLAFMGGIVDTPEFTDVFGKSNTSLVGFLVSSYEVGCLMGGVLMFLLGDRFGRRTINIAGVTIISIGALIQASSFSIPVFLVGRIVAGLGLGMTTTVVPVWLVECSRPSSRGRMIGIQLSNLIMGLIVANWLDYGISHNKTSFRWRFPCAFQIAICLTILVFLPWLPESPRYLAVKRREKKALRALAALRGQAEDDTAVVEEMREIQHAADAVYAAAASASWGDCFRDGGISGWGRVAVCIVVNAGQQLTGSNVLSSFGPYVFKKSMGMTAHEAMLMSGGLQIWFFLSSLIPWFAVDRFNRRHLFIFGSTGMAICMILGAAFTSQHKQGLGYAATVVFYLYYSFYTIGWQANMWVYPSEVLPLNLRQRGSAISMALHWTTTFMVVETTPPMIKGIGWKAFLVYGCFNLAYIPIVYFFFPETSRMPLEAVDLMFADRDGRRPRFTTVVRDSTRQEYRDSLQAELLSNIHARPEKLSVEHLEMTMKA